jgi:hypothetical protein
MNNLNHIANYLFKNPGARYTDITRMLCAKKGKKWTRGHYCRYFIIPTWWSKGIAYPGHLWVRAPDGGWMLTIKGYGYVTLGQNS